MTVIMRDAVTMLPASDRQDFEAGILSELLYADDTLLMSENAQSLENFLRAVEVAGSRFGLSLHADKFQLMKIGCEDEVRRAGGAAIPASQQLVYLGTLISGDGKLDRELARRLGAAQAEFRALARVWRHSCLTRVRKVQIFNAMVMSKLTYALAAACPNVSELRRLDGFQNRCLRTIWGIKPAFISRVSNTEVLRLTAQRPAAAPMLKQQMLLLGKILRTPSEHPLRRACFSAGSLQPATDHYVRRVGRPCREWVKEALADAVRLFGSVERVKQAAEDTPVWTATLKRVLG